MSKKTTTPRRRQEDIDRAKARPIRWDHDFLDREFIPRKDEQPVPSSGIFDAPYVCVKVNAEWWGHVLGVLEVLRWEDFWLGTSADKYRADQEIQKLMALMESCETMFELRDNPNDPCEVQQSFDGGMTWVTAFRKDNCLDPGRDLVIYNDIQNIADEIISQYDGTPESIAPDIPATYDPDVEVEIDLLLCLAIRNFIDMVCATAIEIREQKEAQTDSEGNIVAAVLGIAAVILGPFTGGSSIAAYAAFGTALAAGGLVFYTALPTANISDFQAQAAKDEVVCCMYLALRGSRPTLTQFQQSVNSCPIVENTPAFNIMLATAYTIQEVDSYIAFMTYLNSLILTFGNDLPAAAADCPCVEEWQWDIGFYQGVGSGVRWTQDYVQIVYGTYQAATGHVHGVAATAFGDAGGFVAEVLITLPLLESGALPFVESVIIDTQPKWSAGTSSRPQLWQITGADGLIVDETSGWAFPATTIRKTYAVRKPVATIRVRCRINGDARVLRVRIKGAGENPFLGYP